MIVRILPDDELAKSTIPYTHVGRNDVCWKSAFCTARHRLAIACPLTGVKSDDGALALEVEAM